MPEFVLARRRQCEKMSTAVIWVLPSDHKTLNLQLGDLPAEDWRSDAEPAGKLRSPAFPVTDGPKHEMQGYSKSFSTQAGRINAAQCTLDA